MDVFRLLALLQWVWLHLPLRHLPEFQADLVEACRLVDIGPQPNDGLEYVQLLLLEQELSLLDLVLGRLVIGEEVLLIDGGKVGVIEVVRDFLLVDHILPLLLLELVLLKLLLLLLRGSRSWLSFPGSIVLH
jgi:hypothetical protein